MHLGLLGPAATAWDSRLLSTLWRAAERYIRIGFGVLAPQPDEHHRRQHAHEELIGVFRTRDADAVATAVYAHLNRNEKLAEAGLQVRTEATS